MFLYTVTETFGFANIQAYVRESHGARAWSGLLSTLSAADQDDLGSVIAVGWYLAGFLSRQVCNLLPRTGRIDQVVVDRADATTP